MIKEILLPDLGEGIDAAEVSEVLVSPGKTIKADDIILVLESEKASMEIPAETGGKVKKVLVVPGSTVEAGQCLITLETTAKKTSTKRIKEKTEQVIDEPKTTTASKKLRAPKRETDRAFAAPGVRRLSRELKIDLQSIKGTGPKERITKEDLHSFIRNKMEGAGEAPHPRATEIDFSQWGKIATQKLTKIKGITARRMQQSWQTIPHVTQFDEADITELELFRSSLTDINTGHKKKITPLVFIIKSLVSALIKYPNFNCSIDDIDTGKMTLKKYFHVGIAVDTKHGLMVPKIRNANNKNLNQLSEELKDISDKCRNLKIDKKEFFGGSMTITSLGSIGGSFFTPIINYPEVAILGVGRTYYKQVLINNEFQKRNMLPLSLSYDHRIIDGAEAARFCNELKENLGKNFAYRLAI